MTKIDWTKAPEGAEFYSSGAFRKQDLFGREFVMLGDTWFQCKRNHLYKHEQSPDYQHRPEEPPVKHYKSQMTKEQLQNVKIRIQSPEHSEAFQKMCFEAGLEWHCGIGAKNNKDIDNLSAKFLYAVGEHISYGDTLDYFNLMSDEEITWEPESKATTTTKNPKASLRIQSSNGRYSERTLDNIAMMGDNVKYWLAWLCGENVERLVNQSWHKPAMPSFDRSETYRFAPNKEEQTDYDKIEANKELLKKYGIIIEGYSFDKESVIVLMEKEKTLMSTKELLYCIDFAVNFDIGLSKALT